MSRTRQDTPRYDWPSFHKSIRERALALDCRDVVRHYTGTQLKGSQVLIRCPHPAHEDKNPSCSVRAKKVYCYSCDQVRGDVLTLIGVFEGSEDFKTQVRIALELQGLDYDALRQEFLDEQRRLYGSTSRKPRAASSRTQGSPQAPKVTQPKTPTPAAPNASSRATRATPARASKPPRALDESNQRHKIWSRLLDGLELDDQAATYLSKRCISPALARSVGVVSVSYTEWSDRVQALGRHFGQAALDRAGVLSTRGSAHPYIEKMLVMPYASTGEIVGLRFRRLSQDTTYNGARYVTLRHGSNVVSTPYLADQTGWPVAMAPSGGIIWVVEGEPDTLSLRSLGRAAIGAPGARVWRSGWTASWNKARKVIVVADADRPGVQASQSMFDAIYEDAVAQHGEAWAREHLVSVTVPSAAGETADVNSLHVSGQLATWVRDVEASVR